MKSRKTSTALIEGLWASAVVLLLVFVCGVLVAPENLVSEPHSPLAASLRFGLVR